MKIIFWIIVMAMSSMTSLSSQLDLSGMMGFTGSTTTTTPSPNNPYTNPTPNPYPSSNPNLNSYPSSNPNPNSYPSSNPNPNSYPSSNSNPNSYPSSNPNPNSYPSSNPNPNSYPSSNPNPNSYPSSNLNPNSNYDQNYSPNNNNPNYNSNYNNNTYTPPPNQLTVNPTPAPNVYQNNPQQNTVYPNNNTYSSDYYQTNSNYSPLVNAQPVENSVYSIQSPPRIDDGSYVELPPSLHYRVLSSQAYSGNSKQSDVGYDLYRRMYGYKGATGRNNGFRSRPYPGPVSAARLHSQPNYGNNGPPPPQQPYGNLPPPPLYNEVAPQFGGNTPPYGRGSPTPYGGGNPSSYGGNAPIYAPNGAPISYGDVNNGHYGGPPPGYGPNNPGYGGGPPAYDSLPFIEPPGGQYNGGNNLYENEDNYHNNPFPQIDYSKYVEPYPYSELSEYLSPGAYSEYAGMLHSAYNLPYNRHNDVHNSNYSVYGEQSANFKMSVAVVTITGRFGNPTNNNIKGTLYISEIYPYICLCSGVITGLTPNFKYGIAVHTYGDLTNGCQSIGGHYNPNNNTHGNINYPQSHAGDLGNLMADSHGVTFVNKLVKKRFSIQNRNPVAGRSMAVCEKPDDLGLGGNLESLLNGNCGKIIACGGIGYANTAHSTSIVSQHYK